MTKSFLLLICSGADQPLSWQSALDFAQACQQSPHHLARVFFYGSAVLQANSLQDPDSHWPNLLPMWQELAQQGVDLVLCSTACYNHGIQESSAEQQGNLASGFRIGSLADLSLMQQEVDHVIRFG